MPQKFVKKFLKQVSSLIDNFEIIINKQCIKSDCRQWSVMREVLMKNRLFFFKKTEIIVLSFLTSTTLILRIIAK